MKACKKCKVKFKSGNCPKCRSGSNTVSASSSSYGFDFSTFVLLDSYSSSDYGSCNSSSYDSGSSSSDYGSSSCD